MNLWERVNYTSDISYLNNVFIYEMDIQKANINILFSKGLIDDSTYQYLYNAERMVRQVFIGKLQKDRKYVVALQQGIVEAKHKLFEANNIQDYEVLSIKNDAVYTINRIPEIRDFELIHFIPKNRYTGFYRINNLELYYFYNNITKEELLDIKGINKSLDLHKDYFYQFLKDLFYTVQCNGVEIAIRLLKEASADKSVIALKSLEAMSKIADGKATKIIVPSDLSNVATLGLTVSEMIGNNEKIQK